LALTAPPTEALAVWSAGIVLSQAVARKSMNSRMFNIGLCITAGALALRTIDALAPGRETSPRQLAAVTVACAIYFAFDFVVTGVSIALDSGERVSSQVRVDRSALLSLLCFL